MASTVTTTGWGASPDLAARARHQCSPVVSDKRPGSCQHSTHLRRSNSIDLVLGNEPATAVEVTFDPGSIEGSERGSRRERAPSTRWHAAVVVGSAVERDDHVPIARVIEGNIDDRRGSTVEHCESRIGDINGARSVLDCDPIRIVCLAGRGDSRRDGSSDGDGGRCRCRCRTRRQGKCQDDGCSRYSILHAVSLPGGDGYTEPIQQMSRSHRTERHSSFQLSLGRFHGPVLPELVPRRSESVL